MHEAMLSIEEAKELAVQRARSVYGPTVRLDSSRVIPEARIRGQYFPMEYVFHFVEEGDVGGVGDDDDLHGYLIAVDPVSGAVEDMTPPF